MVNSYVSPRSAGQRWLFLITAFLSGDNTLSTVAIRSLHVLTIWSLSVTVNEAGSALGNCKWGEVIVLMIAISET
jgi:hypothetical protein